MVLFDRSWYNRAGVERVMGFCSDAEYEEFMRDLPAVRAHHPAFGRDPLEVLALGQRRGARTALQGTAEGPAKRWKLSPVDVEARARWVDYAEAKDEMFAYTDTKDSPWFVVEADDKRTARLNLIAHLLDQIPYERVDHEKIKLPPRQDRAYVRPPADTQTYVPERYRVK